MGVCEVHIERYIDDPDDATNALRILQAMVGIDRHIQKLFVELGGIETTGNNNCQGNDDIRCR